MRYQVSASTRPAPSAAWQLRMWSKKHSESRIDGGRGIGAISVTSASGTVCDAEFSASTHRLPAAPRRHARDQLKQRHAFGGSGVNRVARQSTPVRSVTSF